jgi:hypothetical protein
VLIMVMFFYTNIVMRVRHVYSSRDTSDSHFLKFSNFHLLQIYRISWEKRLQKRLMMSVSNIDEGLIN